MEGLSSTGLPRLVLELFGYIWRYMKLFGRDGGGVGGCGDDGGGVGCGGEGGGGGDGGSGGGNCSGGGGEAGGGGIGLLQL